CPSARDYLPCHASRRDRHPFPTRRSSDLRTEAGATATGADIRVGVRVAGLQLADHVASVRLGARVLSLGALTEEVRQSDRGQDADDQDYDKELDQRETGLLRLNTRAKLPQHSCDL